MTKKIMNCVAMVVIVCLLAVVTGCGTIVTPGFGPAINGSGTLETREMDYSDFTKIDVGSAFEVDVTRADSCLVRITCDDNLFEYLDIDKRGDTLYIGLKPNNTYSNTTQKAIITSPSLHELELSGASKANVSGFNSPDSMKFELSGASNLDIKDGKAGDTSFELSGASHAFGSIEMADGRFNLSGASSIELDGSANDVSIEASGASHVRLPDFSVIDAEVNLSGASGATIDASGRLDGNLSGASQLRYIGNPTLGKIETSGGSTISQK